MGLDGPIIKANKISLIKKEQNKKWVINIFLPLKTLLFFNSVYTHTHDKNV
jgi:hypothetical protein